jgi:tetratricopeptide (TPR) repeat protein
LGHLPQLLPELRDLIVTQSEGNPFCVEELIKMLVEDGVILLDDSDDQLDMEQVKSLRIPGTLMGVLQARIDRLADEQREMLGQAAVIGRVFWDEAVGYLHDLTEPEFIHEALNALRQRAIVMGRSHSTFGATQEYIFKHALLRDVAYETVLRQLRRRYHAEVAEWVFAKTGDRVQEFAGVIARHYALAEMKTEAAMWYGRSAQQAQASYAIATAVEHYQRALALDEKSPKRLSWLEGLAQMLALQGRFAEAIEQYERLLEAAAMSQDRLFEARIWNQLALTQGRQGDYASSMSSGQRAEALARPVLAEAILAQALIRQGWNSYRLGQTETALSQAEQALSLGQTIGDVRQTAESYLLLGAVKYQLASYAEAAQDQDQAIRLYNTLDDLHYTGIMLNNRAETAKAMGELTTAVTHYQKALTIAREMGNRGAAMIRQLNLSDALVKLGDFETAESELHQLLAQPTIEQAPYHGIAQSHLAEALLGQQQFEPAWQMAQQALLTAQTRQLPILTGTAWRTMGLVLAQSWQELPDLSFDETAAKETTVAARCFAQSLLIFTNNHMKGEQAQTLRAWVEYEEKQGNHDRAVSLQAQAQILQKES